MRWLGLLFAAALVCACADAPTASPEAPAACTPSPERLAELERDLRECAGDADCPCGAGCALGVCTYECAADNDCGAGRSCDGHGRCRP